MYVVNLKTKNTANK